MRIVKVVLRTAKSFTLLVQDDVNMYPTNVIAIETMRIRVPIFFFLPTI